MDGKLLTAELVAVKAAIIFCLQAGFEGDMVIDSQLVARILNESSLSLGVHCFLTEEIKSLLSVHKNFVSVFFVREANHVAHKIAVFQIIMSLG